MLKLKKKHQVPPGGYRYQDPDLNMGLQANTLSQLVADVASLRKANDHDVPENLAEIIEDWICQQIPQSFVLGQKTDAQRKREYMPLSLVKTVTEKFLVQWRIAGKRYCNRDEALRRARICIDCKHNKVNRFCLGCKGLLPWVRTSTQRRTHLDEDLLICDCCAAMNAAVIHADNSYIREATPELTLKDMPASCWRKQICEVKK